MLAKRFRCGNVFHVKQSEGLTETYVQDAIVEAAAAVGVAMPPLTEAQAAALLQLALHVASGGKRLGLTNYSSPRVVLERLIAPAVGASAWLERTAPLRVADIGAGTGAVGMTLAVLCPQWRLTMVDRRQKACRFIEILALRLGLETVEVLQADACKPRPPDLRFDGALFRAVASPRDDLALAAGWVKPSGIAVVWTSAAKLEALENLPGWLFLGKRVVTGRNPWAVAGFSNRRDTDSCGKGCGLCARVG